MPDLTIHFADIPHEAWWWTGIGAGAFLVVGAWPHLRRAWHLWRLRRRLAEDGFMLREERREYELAIGEELQPFDAGRWPAGALGGGAIMAAPFVFEALEAKELWDEATLLFSAAVAFLALWRWINDPPPEDGEGHRGPPEVPREAVYGLAGGLALVAVVLVAVFAIF